MQRVVIVSALRRPICVGRAQIPITLASPATTRSWRSSKLPGSRALSLSVRCRQRAADQQRGVPVVTYDELKPHTKSPTEDLLLIDVREPPEFTQGNIPSSVNLPLSELEEALKMDPNDFKRKYSFTKPSTDKNIIFYCLAGVRAAAAAKEFQSQHYRNVSNFEGSYQEWTRREGKWSASDDDD